MPAPLSICLLMLLALSVLAPAEECVVGVVLSLSGAGSAYSHDGLEGLETAVAELNRDGGLCARHPIRLVVVDDGTKAELAAARTAELLATAHPQVVIGPYSSACALALKPLLNQAQVIHLSPIANAERITRGDPAGWSFLVGPNTYMQGRASALAVAKLAREKGWKRYATMASDYEFGRSTQAAFVATLRELAPELELVLEVWPRLGEPRFDPLIAQLAAAKPDFVYPVLASDDNRKWMQAAQDFAFFIRFPCPGMMITVTELQAQRATMPRGLVALARAPFFAHPDEPLMAAFVAAYQARYQHPPSDWAVLCRDAVGILAQAAERADAIAPAALRAALLGGRFATSRGSCLLRAADHQLICPSYVGTVADDPAYPFPILHGLQIIRGEDCVRPPADQADQPDQPAGAVLVPVQVPAPAQATAPAGAR